MGRLPFFFEATATQQTPELSVCRKIMRILFQNKIVPLPFASNLNEFDDILGNLATRQMVPAVYIINTLGAEDLLLELDGRMSEVPTLFLRRGLSWDKRVKDMLGAGEGVTSVLSGMKPRLAAVWGYGTKNSDDVASFAAQCLMRLLTDGDFRYIERQSRFSLNTYPMAG